VPLGPYHIATWAFDNTWAEGGGAPAAAVNQLVSYAQGGSGGDGKALADCHSSSNGCKAVFYLNPNHPYVGGTGCNFHPDAEVVAAASESWFVHDAGYSDSAHRVYGISRGGCTVWEMNQNSSGVQAWWRSYLQSKANTYDLYFLDNDPMSVINEGFFSGSGGGCIPWPSYCRSTQEIPNDSAQVLAHANFANALTHSNGSPMHFFYQQASFNVPLDMSAFTTTDRLIGVTCEGCVAAIATAVQSSAYMRVLDEMAAVNASPGAFMLISHGNSPAGSATQILQRSVTTGIVWLAYSEGHTIVQPDLEVNTKNLAIWPEDLIYPSRPLQSMNSGANDLQVASGVWRREFTTCYQAGRFFGRCAAIVNSTGSPLPVQSSWLSQVYGHVIGLSGGDVLSGGVAAVGGAAFVPNVTTVPAAGALLLSQ
jgi:hypothetical protein